MVYFNSNCWAFYSLLLIVSLISLNSDQVEGIRKLLQSSNSTIGPHHEYARIHVFPTAGTRLFGGYGEISVWDPFVSTNDDFSLASITVVIGDGAHISAGWIVHPELYGDFQSRFFIYWTTDDGDNTGCFDLNCVGFVHVDKTVPVGVPFAETSTLGAADALVVKLLIFLNPEDGNWWLNYGNTPVGFWPSSLFTGFPDGAASLNFGGTVFDSIGSGLHTSTDMGNGNFPSITPPKSSYVCSIQYIDSTNTFHVPDQSILGLGVTNPLCYNAQIIPATADGESSLCAFFGGSGLNPSCP